jgi:hypothetical protein
LESGGTFLHRRASLTFQAQFEQLLGKDFAKLDHEVFELRQLGAPGGPLRPPDAIRQVFGDTFEVIACFFYLWTPLIAACHPWLLIEVKVKIKTNLQRQSTRRPPSLANYVPHPLPGRAINQGCGMGD